MQSERFIVKFITVNNCFAYLPDTWLRKLEIKVGACSYNQSKIVHRKTYITLIIHVMIENLIC